MKILAVRVREVGLFRDAVALEDLSGGLDVLVGPNEFGKSTLFRAIEASFAIPHTANRKDVRAWMVPDSGGAPQIEVDFELAGARYRLRKRYFTNAKALLTRLDGDLTLRGSDAEARLSELLAEAGATDRLGMMWVGQRQSLDPMTLAGKTRDGLKTLIEREISLAVGGSELQAVRGKVRERLDSWLTGAKRQPRGAYKEAVELHERLSRDGAALQLQVADGRARHELLARLIETQNVLGDPAMVRQRTDRTARARATLEAARTAWDKRRAAEEQWLRLEQDNKIATDALAGFDRLRNAFDTVTIPTPDGMLLGIKR